jgi:hypothetical protein
MPICTHCKEDQTYDKLSTCVDRGSITYECVTKCFNETEKKQNAFDKNICDINDKINALKKKIKKITKIFHIKDITNIYVSGMCYLTLPCQHDVTIETSDGSYDICLSGTILKVLSRFVNLTGITNDHFDYILEKDFAKALFDKLNKEIEENKYILYSSMIILFEDNDEQSKQNVQDIKNNKEYENKINELNDLKNKIKDIVIDDKNFYEKLNILSSTLL